MPVCEEYFPLYGMVCAFGRIRSPEIVSSP
jgi:hypothetical protein